MAGVTLSAARLDSVARLRDDPTVLPTLRRARLSRDTAFLAIVVRSGGHAAAYRTLVEAQQRAPEAVRALMEHPRFGAWAAAASADPRHAEHLAAFAASAAIQARIPFDLEVPVRDGWIVLPGLGAIAVEPGVPSLRLNAENGLAWRPLRRIALTAAAPATIEFDEFPMLTVNEGAFPLAPPLSDQDFEPWHRRLSAAVRLLSWTVPSLAAPLLLGMRTIIPLAHQFGAARAASLSDAFGAAALTCPTDAVNAATTLVHEFQHSKLSVLSEIVPMVADDAPDLYSPWKAQPRPASAVLHGAFAHLAVAHLWARLAQADRTAWAEAELTRAQTISGCAELTRSGRLTEAGRRFVAALDQTAHALDRAPGSIRTSTATRLAAHRADWTRAQRRNPATVPVRHPDPARSE